MKLARIPLAAALVATAAFGGVPEKGEGTITLLSGVRLIPNGAYQNETGAKHSLWHPGFLLGFGYQLDDELHGGIQLGYGLDRYGVGGDALSIRSFQILLELDTPLVQGSWFTVYGGGGLGYSLNTATRQGADTEANSSAGFIMLGWRIRLTDALAAVIEDRYTVSSASADTSARNAINVGGNLLSAGLQIHFFSPEEKGHPRRPGE